MEPNSVLYAVTHSGAESILVQGGTKFERFFQKINLVPNGTVMCRFQEGLKVIGSV
jgi:hypothetical protein